jgi:hypothetical protein
MLRSRWSSLPRLREVHMQRFVWLFLAAAAIACGSGSSGNNGGVQLMPGFDPGPAPDPSKGFQIILPAVQNIEPLASDEYCTDTSMILPQDIWIDATQGFQTETGHHVLLFYVTNPVAPSTHICANDEMAEFQFGMPSTGGAGDGKTFTLPGNLAVKIPKGSQIVVNHHYLNASSKAVSEAQSAINVYYADPSVPHTTSSLSIVEDTQLTVPVGASSYDIDCTINQDYASWLMFPHMHNWGTHVTVTDTSAATGATQQLFDLDWQADYAFDFTEIGTTSSPSNPFMFNKGDKIHIECDYMNNTGATMTFGDEMCVFAAFTVDSSNLGDWYCDRGVWGTF